MTCPIRLVLYEDLMSPRSNMRLGEITPLISLAVGRYSESERAAKVTPRGPMEIRTPGLLVAFL